MGSVGHEGGLEVFSLADDLGFHFAALHTGAVEGDAPTVVKNMMP